MLRDTIGRSLMKEGGYPLLPHVAASAAASMPAGRRGRSESRLECTFTPADIKSILKSNVEKKMCMVIHILIQNLEGLLPF